MIIQYSSNVLESDENTLNGIKVVHQTNDLTESFHNSITKRCRTNMKINGHLIFIFLFCVNFNDFKSLI